jgi:hypothetical protein
MRPSLILSLTVAAAVALAPTWATAADKSGIMVVPAPQRVPAHPADIHRGAGIRTIIQPVQPVQPPAPPALRAGIQRTTTTFSVFSPAVIYAPPPGSYDVVVAPAPRTRDESPVAYLPPVAYASAPPASYASSLAYPPQAASYPPYGGVMAPPPVPTVVEFSTGRYVLQGDGMTTPYMWAWIPNPPTAPPLDDDDDPSDSGPRQLYRWTDEGGVAYWTDRLESVPERYRAEAEAPRSN